MILVTDKLIKIIIMQIIYINPLLSINILGILILILALCLTTIYLYRQNRLLKETIEKEEIKNIIDKQLQDIIPVSFVIATAEGGIVRINKMLLNELELLHKNIEGKNITEIIEIIHDKKNVFSRYLKEMSEENCIIKFDTNTFIREPQKNIRFLIEGALVGIYRNHKLVRIVLFYRNVLEERTQKHVMNIALSTTQIFPWSYDMDRNLMAIDPRYFEYLDIPTKDYTLTMEEFQDLVHPDDRKELFDRLGKQVSGQLYEDPVSFRIHRGDGKWEWFEGQSTYVGQLSDLPFRIVGICMSIQRHKDNENKLNEALVKARQSDELKSAFLANMSHEIRTPLNAVVGFSSLLSSQIEDTSEEERKEYATLIEKNSNSLMMLISDILDLSKIESNSMEFKFCEVSLNKLFTGIAASQKIDMQEGVRLEFTSTDNDIKITTDPSRLEQVINNLINNAKKFTEQGFIRIGYEQINADTIELFVEDTGQGMSEEVMSHIFERFYKADTFVQGTGLGLAICQTIISRFEGKINVSSKEGKGSRFSIVLPTHPVEP